MDLGQGRSEPTAKNQTEPGPTFVPTSQITSVLRQDPDSSGNVGDFYLRKRSHKSPILCFFRGGGRGVGIQTPKLWSTVVMLEAWGYHIICYVIWETIPQYNRMTQVQPHKICGITHNNDYCTSGVGKTNK